MISGPEIRHSGNHACMAGVANMNKIIAIILMGLWAGSVQARLPGILSWETEQNLEIVYRQIYIALEKSGYYVIFEPNIGRNLAGLARHWGDEYNRNQVQDIRSMEFFNAAYTNQISNVEPDLLALWPLQISFYRQGTVTHVVFNRPTYIGRESRAGELLEQIESDVSAAIQAGIDAAARRPVRPPTTR
jgi:hypothetical protein